MIPNLSYVSEAAAYTLDCRLQTNLVPYTDIVHLSSKSFHYDFWSRRNFHRRGKSFPAKVGSFQVFLKGFKDANIFLRENPWPDNSSRLRQTNQSEFQGTESWTDRCRPSSSSAATENANPQSAGAGGPTATPFVWTEKLQQAFREQLEKLVILDYIMRNTDRGLDNWMIKVDYNSQEVSIVADRPMMTTGSDLRPNRRLEEQHLSAQDSPHTYKPQAPMSSNGTAEEEAPSITIGAIDNSLSWPWKHPDAWRSFPFGWLFLPVSLIGQPFSTKTREHFLPLLTSKQWWAETQIELRRVFSQDADFQERMFAGQIAVMKGQAWNVVEALKEMDHGPLELTRRARVCVWDDIVKIPVAVPMRPSAEMHRKRRILTIKDPDEMDISSANSPFLPPSVDLPGSGSAASELPNHRRFELTSTSHPTDGLQSTEQHSSSAATTNARAPPLSFSEASTHESPRRKRPGHERNRVSENGSPFVPVEPRRDPLPRTMTSNSHAAAPAAYYADDLEGDLGYSAASYMDGHQRKVIVERLEMVKSKQPLFTWC